MYIFVQYRVRSTGNLTKTAIGVDAIVSDPFTGTEPLIPYTCRLPWFHHFHSLHGHARPRNQ